MILTIAQWVSFARIVILFLGGLAVGHFGITQEDVATFSSIDTLTAVIGGLAAVGAAFSAIYSRRNAGIIKSAAKLPEVAKITTDPETAAAIPSNKVQSGY